MMVGRAAVGAADLHRDTVVSLTMQRTRSSLTDVALLDSVQVAAAAVPGDRHHVSPTAG